MQTGQVQLMIDALLLAIVLSSGCAPFRRPSLINWAQPQSSYLCDYTRRTNDVSDHTQCRGQVSWCYAQWKYRMEFLLEQEDLWTIVNKTEKKDLQRPVWDLVTVSWERRDRIVKVLIVLCMDSQMLIQPRSSVPLNYSSKPWSRAPLSVHGQKEGPVGKWK